MLGHSVDILCTDVYMAAVAEKVTRSPERSLALSFIPGLSALRREGKATHLGPDPPSSALSQGRCESVLRHTKHLEEASQECGWGLTYGENIDRPVSRRVRGRAPFLVPLPPP